MKTVHLIMGYKTDYPKIINLAPELERYCKELKKMIDLDNDNPHFIEDMNEYRVRQLLKSRVKRIRILQESVRFYNYNKE